MTQHDIEKIKKISENLSLSKLAFLHDTGREVTITAFNPDSQKYSGFYEEIVMFGSSPIQKIEGEFLFEDVSFIPFGNLFDDYLSEMVEIPLFTDGMLTEHESAKNFITKNSVHELDLPIDSILFVEPYSSTGYFYSKLAEKPFLAIIEGEVHHFDEKEPALKVEYDKARVDSDFLSKDSREKLESFQEWLDSPAFEEHMNEELEKARAVTDEHDRFYQSGEFHTALSSLKSDMNSYGDSIISFESYTGDYGKTTIEELFNIVECAYHKGDEFEVEDCDFYTTCVELDGFRFEKIHGQGVINSISIL